MVGGHACTTRLARYTRGPLYLKARDGGDVEYPFGVGLAGVIGVAVGVAANLIARQIDRMIDRLMYTVPNHLTSTYPQASLLFMACVCRLALNGYSCRKEVIPPPPANPPDDQNQNKPEYSSAYSGSI